MFANTLTGAVIHMELVVGLHLPHGQTGVGRLRAGPGRRPGHVIGVEAPVGAGLRPEDDMLLGWRELVVAWLGHLHRDAAGPGLRNVLGGHAVAAGVGD